MNIHILAFGIARDILKAQQLELTVDRQLTVGELKTELCQRYPEFEKLRSFSIAVNTAYQTDHFVLSESDEIVIIPPVSGG